jgi:hypothetical protein
MKALRSPSKRTRAKWQARLYYARQRNRARRAG